MEFDLEHIKSKKKIIIIKSNDFTSKIFRHLNECAIKIQKNWRGFQQRRKYRVILDVSLFHIKSDIFIFIRKTKEHVRNMRLTYYNQNAIMVCRQLNASFILIFIVSI